MDGLVNFDEHCRVCGGRGRLTGTGLLDRCWACDGSGCQTVGVIGGIETKPVYTCHDADGGIFSYNARWELHGAIRYPDGTEEVWENGVRIMPPEVAS